jgi:hypothetical protein
LLFTGIIVCAKMRFLVERQTMSQGSKVRKYKVTSGDYVVSVKEASPRDAMNLAMKIHYESHQFTKLGELMMSEELDSNSLPTGLLNFEKTQTLIDDNNLFYKRI